MQHIVKYQRKASHLLNEKNKNGTKFKIFPQPRYIEGFEEPETIRVSLPPDEIGKGPSDTRMYVVDAKNKDPYTNRNGNLPPYKGEYFEPPKPDQDGHYNNIDINSRTFLSTTMYATLRFSLDIWESYMGPIQWVTQKDINGIPKLDRLELIPLINEQNAFAWFGYVEYGYSGNRPSNEFDINEIKPFCENLDVLGHELGHNIIFSFVGFPRSIQTYYFGGFHESAGDLTSIIVYLHFDKVVDKLLNKTKGNLFSFNTLGRLAELSETTQIRNAFNDLKISDVDPRKPHDLSEPLTGAFFDILVEVYQLYLVNDGLISDDLARRSLNDEKRYDKYDPIEIKIQNDFNSAYKGKEQQFKDNLLKSRDYLGKLLAKLWKSLSPNDFSYSNVLEKVIQIENDMSKDENRKSYVNIINNCFEWREIRLPINNLILPRKICASFKKY